MPVIINDLEVILDSPEITAEPDAPPEAEAQPPGGVLDPGSLARIERHRRARAARVRAH